MKKSNIRYNPSLSVAENAHRNGCSESAIRKHIKTNGIDRRVDQKIKTLNLLQKQYEDGMTAYTLSQKTGISISTVRRYLHYITDEKYMFKIDTNKYQKLTLRQRQDYYATDPSVTRDILGVEEFNSPILEPCCGGGFMAREIERAGYAVDAYDLIDRGYGTGGTDFLSNDWEAGKYDIVTNPPYTDVVAFIRQALKICRNKVAIFMPLRYLSSKERFEVFKQYPPKRVYVYIERICIAKNGDFDNYEAGQNLEIYAWYIWEKGYQGETTLKWLHNNR